MAPRLDLRVGDADVVAHPAPAVGPRALETHRSNRRRTLRRRYRHNRHLRDLLTGRQRLTLLGLILVWALSTASGVRWWVDPEHWTSTTGIVLNSVPLGIELIVLPIWLYWGLWRMKRPNSALVAPRLRTAMFVTKAPSEPWSVVRMTLEAMLAQNFPFH
jgi:cellulose synthase (UDP-forming)